MDFDKLRKKFFTDPDWAGVETLIREYINPLLEMDTVDLSQPAEHIKAEIIGRRKAYEALDKFLRETGMVSKGRALSEKNVFQ